MVKVLEHCIEYCDGEYRITVRGESDKILRDYCELTIATSSDELNVSMKMAGLLVSDLRKLGEVLIETADKITEINGE